MPPAVAPAVDAAPPQAEKPPRRPLTKKKLVALLLGGVLLALAIGGTTLVVLKKRAAAAAALAEAEGAEPAAQHAGENNRTPPTYVPLEAFTVNLADKDAERFAQVGVTFELEDAHAVEQVKNYLPSIRNAILLLLAQQTSADLLGRAGKERLAREIGRAATRAMGYDLPAEEPAADAASAAGGEQAIAHKRPPRKAEPIGPIRRVHFANFIIQ